MKCEFLIVIGSHFTAALSFLRAKGNPVSNSTYSFPFTSSTRLHFPPCLSFNRHSTLSDRGLACISVRSLIHHFNTSFLPSKHYTTQCPPQRTSPTRKTSRNSQRILSPGLRQIQRSRSTPRFVLQTSDQAVQAGVSVSLPPPTTQIHSVDTKESHEFVLLIGYPLQI